VRPHHVAWLNGLPRVDDALITTPGWRTIPRRSPRTVDPTSPDRRRVSACSAAEPADDRTHSTTRTGLAGGVGGGTTDSPIPTDPPIQGPTIRAGVPAASTDRIPDGCQARPTRCAACRPGTVPMAERDRGALAPGVAARWGNVSYRRSASAARSRAQPVSASCACTHRARSRTSAASRSAPCRNAAVWRSGRSVGRRARRSRPA
jgi:hypothetical protein